MGEDKEDVCKDVEYLVKGIKMSKWWNCQVTNKILSREVEDDWKKEQ